MTYFSEELSLETWGGVADGVTVCTWFCFSSEARRNVLVMADLTVVDATTAWNLLLASCNTPGFQHVYTVKFCEFFSIGALNC